MPTLRTIAGRRHRQVPSMWNTDQLRPAISVTCFPAETIAAASGCKPGIAIDVALQEPLRICWFSGLDHRWHRRVAAVRVLPQFRPGSQLANGHRGKFRDHQPGQWTPTGPCCDCHHGFFASINSFSPIEKDMPWPPMRSFKSPNRRPPGKI